MTVNEKLLSSIIKDNIAMRKAGGELAEAATYVIHNYDGLHRLSLAVAKWATTIANESGRKQ